MHPGIVRCLGYGTTEGGEPYLVMEWLDGEDLALRLRRGPLAVAAAVLLGRQVAEALGAAHRRGILEALDKSGGNQKEAAERLGISRRTLLKRLDEYQLPRPRKR